MADEPEAEAADAPEKSGGKKKILVLALILMNVLTVGGLGAYVVLSGGEPAAAEAAAEADEDGDEGEDGEEEEEEEEEEEGEDKEESSSEGKEEAKKEGDGEAEAADESSEGGGDGEGGGESNKYGDLGPTVAVGSFVINLNEPGGIHYLKASMRLEVEQQDVATEVKARDAQLRDMVISYMSSLSIRDTQGIKAKERIRRDLVRRFNQVLQTGRVTRVFFTEFVTQ